MKGNFKLKKNKKLLLILITICFIILIVAVCILLNVNKTNSDEKNEKEITNNEEYVEDNSAIISKLKNMEERDRIEYYFRTFLDYIESGKYEKAYNLLNNQFKESYFPTIDEFKEYCNKTFPEMANIKFDNIERNGEIYILWIYISDALNSSKNDDGKSINVVVKENNLYDFELSFSVM